MANPFRWIALTWDCRPISALAIFVCLAAGIFVGCFEMMKGWGGPETP